MFNFFLETKSTSFEIYFKTTIYLETTKALCAYLFLFQKQDLLVLKFILNNNKLRNYHGPLCILISY
jgi:hypothetical protein